MKKPFSSLFRYWRAPLAVLGGALILSGNVPLWAQSTTAGSSSPVPAPATPQAFSAPSNTNVQAVGPNFKLQAGDVLSVQVANHPDMSSQAISVGANGKLNLPVVGALTAQGKTIGQVTADITRAYAQQLKRPQVAVTLVSSVARQLSIRGAVGKPGPVDVRNGLLLSEAISAAGGLIVDGTTLLGDEVKATLIRGNSAPRPLDLGEALAVPQSPANITLKAGDIINISALPVVRVSITGDAVPPGTIEKRLSSAQQQVRISDVVRGANGISKPEQTTGYLLRKGQKIDLNIADLTSGKPDADLVLQTGDRLYFGLKEVKKINVSVYSADGAIKAPGNYSFDGEATALRTLIQAGGFVESVRPDQVSIEVHRGAEIIPVDIQNASLNPKADVKLEDRDLVVASFNQAPRVQLLGSISKPDTYRFKEGVTLLEALNTAGGLALPADRTNIRVVRSYPDGKQVGLTADAGRLINLTDLSQNLKLQDGDVVFVSEAKLTRQVYVSGEVSVPGAYDLNAGDGLAELMLKAGQAKPTAMLSKVSIVSRNGSKRLVDASAITEGAKVEFALQEGDYVSVPLNAANVTVLGAVGKPDNYPIPENKTLTLGNAILLAGGAAGNAKLQDVAVVHRLGDGTTKTDIIPIDKVNKGILTIDTPLRNGDVVYVPPQGRYQKSDSQKITQALGFLSLGLRFF